MICKPFACEPIRQNHESTRPPKRAAHVAKRSSRNRVKLPPFRKFRGDSHAALSTATITMFRSIFVVLFLSSPLYAQELTLQQVRLSGEFSAKTFSANWDDAKTYIEIRDGAIVRVDPVSDERETLVSAANLIPPGSQTAISVASFTFSESRSKVLIFTNTQRVWRHNTRGDYWIFDRKTERLRKLGASLKPRSLLFAKISPEEKRVAYVSENNLYAEAVDSGAIVALTTDGGERFINGTFDWVYEEEFDLRDGFRWSPDGTKIAFWQLDTSEVPVFTLIDNTSSFYPTIKQFQYPRVGTTNPAAKIGVVSLDRPGTATWVPIPGDPRNNYLVDLDWVPDGDTPSLFLRQMNRLQNEQRIYIVPERNSFQNPWVFRTETDAAWIDLKPIRRLSDGKRFLSESETDGWNHLYLSDVSRPELRTLLTPQPMDVIEFLAFDYDAENRERGVYFYASPDNATQRYLYYCPLDGTEVRRITPPLEAGTHQYNISKDGKLAFHIRSSLGVPPISELVRLPNHEKVKEYETNDELREKISKLKLGKTEFFSVRGQTADGGRQEEDTLIDGCCIYPVDFDPGKKYPVLVYVYGEPAGQTVLDRWDSGGYFWHQMLAQKGYFIVSFDNRGTPAPKGRDWRKSIYKQIGRLGPADQAAALRNMLAERPYLDAERIGIWGWSGGGSMALHALFQYPDLYKTGIAIASVPDERYYDTIYQERYMGLPGATNGGDEAYKNCSPITYAKNLRGNLLIIHGTGDDNTHYQTAELLFDELIRNGKQFRMMVYPGRTHGIHEGAGTTKHLWTLITDYLLENL